MVEVVTVVIVCVSVLIICADMCHSPSILLYAKHMFEMQKSAYHCFVLVSFVSWCVICLIDMFAYHDVVAPEMSESVILSIHCEIR